MKRCKYLILTVFLSVPNILLASENRLIVNQDSFHNLTLDWRDNAKSYIQNHDLNNFSVDIDDLKKVLSTNPNQIRAYLSLDKYQNKTYLIIVGVKSDGAIILGDSVTGIAQDISVKNKNVESNKNKLLNPSNIKIAETIDNSISKGTFLEWNARWELMSKEVLTNRLIEYFTVPKSNFLNLINLKAKRLNFILVLNKIRNFTKFIY